MRFGFLGEGSGRPFLASPRAVAAAAILHPARNSRFSRAQLVMNRGPGPVAGGGCATRGGESRGVLISIKLIDKLGMSWCPVPAACAEARAMIKIDIHQHLWTEPLVQALAERRELPFVRREHGLTVLFLAGERPYVIDLSAEAPARRAALVELDGLDRALLCLSSPLGIESLPREQSLPLIDAYHDGVLSLARPFGVWGAIALDRPDPDDVERAIGRGCVGLSLPAGALRSVDALSRLHSVLARLEALGAPLLVHPGPGPGPANSRAVGEESLGDSP